MGEPNSRFGIVEIFETLSAGENFTSIALLFPSGIAMFYSRTFPISENATVFGLPESFTRKISVPWEFSPNLALEWKALY